MSEIWKDDHTIKTPWGFTLEQAFEAMRFKAIVMNDPNPSNSYNPDREKPTATNMFGAHYSCLYSHCQNDRGAGKLCYTHRQKLVEFRERREAERKKRAKEAKEAYETWKFRQNRMSYFERHMDALERSSQRPIIAQARREYREEKSSFGKRYSGPPRAGYVYRLYDSSKTLLYVGKTYSVKARLFGKQGHANTKEWFNDALAVQITEYRSESDALVAEGFAIREENPIYNVSVPMQKHSRGPKKVSEYWEFVSELDSPGSRGVSSSL